MQLSENTVITILSEFRSLHGVGSVTYSPKPMMSFGSLINKGHSSAKIFDEIKTLAISEIVLVSINVTTFGVRQLFKVVYTDLEGANLEATYSLLDEMVGSALGGNTSSISFERVDGPHPVN